MRTESILTFNFEIIFGIIGSVSDVLAQTCIILAVVGHAVIETILQNGLDFVVDRPVNERLKLVFRSSLMIL